jgi:transcription elongation factor Elf1
MRRRNIVEIRFFQCPVCSAKMSAPKYNGKTINGHIKTMYCYSCGKDRDFVQIDSAKHK